LIVSHDPPLKTFGREPPEGHGPPGRRAKFRPPERATFGKSAIKCRLSDRRARRRLSLRASFLAMGGVGPMISVASAFVVVIRLPEFSHSIFKLAH